MENSIKTQHNTTMETRTQKLSILMLPWLAHGHISPYLELSKRLSTKNIHIYFCSTPINLKSIKIPPKYSQSIQLVDLHLPSLPNLPPHYHTTKGLPPNLMTTLKQAFDMASPAFTSLLQHLKPDLIIYDMVQFWVPSVASSLNIPAVHLLTFSCVTTSFIIHYSRNRETETQYPFSKIFVRDYMKPKITHLLESTANGVADKDRYFRSYDMSCSFILVKTFTELEGKYIDFLSELLNKKVVPVGPIIESIDESESETTTDDETKMILNWLDKKKRSSTVFVSFGTECFLSETERTEIAHGLELSQVNFIWVVRFPTGEKMEIKEALPDGFYERTTTKDKGLIVANWAKQGRILKHESIGGFVSHCGWSSVLESLGAGVPIVAVPMQLDQPLNARLVEEVGVGVEVVRNEKGEIEREEISRVVREVVVEETGETVRRKVKEMREDMMKKGDQEIDDVVTQLNKLIL